MEKKVINILLTILIVLLLAGCEITASNKETDALERKKQAVQSEEMESSQEAKDMLSKQSDDSAKVSSEDQKDIFAEENWAQAVTTLDTSKAFTMDESVYQVYRGTLDEKNVVIAVWMENAYESVIFTIVGEDGQETTIEASEIGTNLIGTERKTVKLAVSTDEIGSLIGAVMLDGSNIESLNATLTHINDTGSKEKRYFTGDNDRVEEFADRIRQAVMNKDSQTLADYMEYPVTLYLNGGEVTVHSKEEFTAIDSSQLFGHLFVEDMTECIPQFLLSNDQGIMLGTGQNNVWFETYDSDIMDQYKITGINESNEIE